MKTYIAMLSLVLLGCAGMAQEMFAGPGFANGKPPIEVGKCTGEHGKGATKIEGKTSSTGNLGSDFKNTSGLAATDVHVRVISPAHARIESITTAEIDDDSSAMTQDASPALPGGEAGASCSGSESLGTNKQLKVTVKLQSSQNGLPLVNEDVKLEIWWTSAGDAICSTSTTDIGEDRPPTGLASVVPDYNATAIDAESDEVSTLNDICLAERDGYRFRRGSLVFTPGSRTSFAMSVNTRVEVYDENGDEVATDIVTVSELRIDDRGNFVFDLVRGASEKHVVLVIRGLMLCNVHRDNGEEVWCSVAGAAISGATLTNNWKIANVSDE